MITVLSHELRSPLTYVTGYTELALERASSSALPGELQELLVGIKMGADRLARLIEDFLFLVRLDSGWAAVEITLQARVRRDLHPIVERAVQLYAEQAAAHGVLVEIRVPPDLPPVRLSESFFVDALGRLVDNAIKFSWGEGKSVTVSARAVDGRVEVAVVDEGVGIPPSEMPHLFERLYQIGREEMEQQGAGLGLAIARQLINLQGGEITVESVPGQGSTFTIHMPVVEEG